MVKIKVELDKKSLREINRLFKELKKRAKDPSNAFARASAVMEADIFDHFRTKVDSKGNPWPPVKYPPVPSMGDVLQRSGTLRQSIGKQSSRRNAEVFSQMEYAAAHDFGMRLMIRPKNKRFLAWRTASGEWAFSKGHEINIPKREFMYISDKAFDRIREVFSQELLNDIA